MAAIAKTLIPRNLQEPEPLQPIVLPDSMPQPLPEPEPTPMRVPEAPLAPFPQVAQPKVVTPSPLNRQISHDQQKLEKIQFQQAHPWGTAENHPGVGGKIAHVLSVAGNIAGNIVAPNVMANIPGTQLNRQVQEGDTSERLSKEQEQQSQENLQGAETAQKEQQTKAAEPIEITPDQAQELNSPELAGVQVAPSVLATLYKQHGINTQRQTANELTNQTRLGVANIQAISRKDLAALKPEQRDDRAIRLNQKLEQGEQLTPEESSYLKAYAKYIDQTKVQPGVARAVAFGQFRPVQALNLETGQPEWNWSGQAVGQHMGTTSNIPFRTAAGMAKFMTSGKGGQTITAYNTANDHLDLLGKAMDALDNGDVQALNQLNNSFKQQFGKAAPTNVNAVKAMLAGELANVAKVTGATDQEIQEQKENINRSASPEQIRGFIETNHDLMDQKAYEMFQQYQQGMQGKPAFNTGLTGRGPQNVGGGGTVKLKAPDGSVQDVPESQVDHYIRLGAQRVK